MKNTENAAKPMSAIVYRHVCPWRLSTRPAQTSFRSDRSSSSAFMPSWNHIDPQDGSANRAPESNSRTQDPRADLRLRFSRIENRWIISGDADLLVLDVFRDIPIITPAAFGRAQVP